MSKKFLLTLLLLAATASPAAGQFGYTDDYQLRRHNRELDERRRELEELRRQQEEQQRRLDELRRQQREDGRSLLGPGSRPGRSLFRERY